MRVSGAVAIAVLVGGPAMAQAPPPPLSPAQIEQLAPAAAPRLSPGLRPALPEPATGPGAQALIRIASVQVSGNTALPEAALLAVLEPLVGAPVPLAAIEDARIGVIAAYGQAGFPFVAASADLAPGPDGAILVLRVTEAEIAAVRLDGDIGPAGTQVLRFLAPLVGGTIDSGRLERALLLAGDVPGVALRSVIRPLQGAGAGALELVAQVSRQAVSGYLAVDNRGYELTGPVQALFAIGTNAFTEYGERIEATLFQAQDSEQTFGVVSAEAFLGGSGLRLRAYAGSGLSRPAGFLRQTGYRGTTTVAGAALQYPVIRSRPLNLFASLHFDLLDTEVETGTPRARQSLDEVRVLRAGLEGNALDTLLPFAPAPAINSASLRLHQGVGWFGQTRAGEVPGPGRIGSEFRFAKWSAEASRQQPLWAPEDGAMVSLFGLVAGQRSQDVLPTSEKFLFGGNRLGRGFYAGQVTGDTAIAASLELQLDLRPAPFRLAALGEVSPAAQFYLFRDFGRSFETVPTDPNRTVESWGGGVRLYLTEAVQLDLEAVRRLTRRVDAAGGAVPPLAETAAFFRLLTRF
jgi:hemolysin activation/secretion protein